MNLKQEVGNFWNTQPCGTQFTNLPWGSPEFFDEVERFRYQVQPFMNRVINFTAYRGKTLLEVGCGLGTDLLQFARAGAKVTGIDLTESGIELTRRRFEWEGLEGNFHVADAENLPFDDAIFDVVYSFGVLHHTPEITKAIKEIHRVLKPSGELILMLYHRNSIHVWLGTPLHIRKSLQKQGESVSIFRWLGEIFGRWGYWTDDWIRIFDGENNPLGRAYSINEIRKLLSDFRNVKITICDPIRRRYPKWLNLLNQKFLAPFFGFYAIAKGQK